MINSSLFEKSPWAFHCNWETLSTTSGEGSRKEKRQICEFSHSISPSQGITGHTFPGWLWDFLEIPHCWFHLQHRRVFSWKYKLAPALTPSSLRLYCSPTWITKILAWKRGLLKRTPLQLFFTDLRFSRFLHLLIHGLSSKWIFRLSIWVINLAAPPMFSAAHEGHCSTSQHMIDSEANTSFLAHPSYICMFPRI